MAPTATDRHGPRDVGGRALRCLVTGSTGYIGGRLVPVLLAAGEEVRCLVRDRRRLRDQPWQARVEVVEADVTRPETLPEALAGVDVAYYLVHALGTGKDFERTDARAAEEFGRAARTAGVRRIVYLGGLVPRGVPDRELSPHLRSRAEVGRILRGSGVPTAELRAAVVIGSGSASFEMLRYLTERLPAMVTPRWVNTRIQPVAVRDVLRFLAGCARLPREVNRSFDIGGPDVLTYREMMLRYAAVAGLPHRLIVPVPVLTPGLSSHWVGLVTPVPRAIARPLVESLRYEVVCDEHDLARYVPDPEGGLLGFEDAVALALRRVREAEVETRWSSASLPGAPSDSLPTDPAWAGGSLYQDDRTLTADVDPAALWRVVEGIGGEHGWYSFPLAWAVRGWLDRLAGGVGLRRGRRDRDRLRVGDSLDFWRVEEIVPGRLLRLRAEMRLPGLAWLELGVEQDAHGRTRYRQRALFHPHGLAGHLYWWSVAPFHTVVFGGMARNIVGRARDTRQGPGRGDDRGPAAVGVSGWNRW
ncbi:SDR family oxidoreductase [Streptacidiphilus cavernicola]|uniref:SDR family oxidoreductase n=1 Tax=Streptacidiphilus cavernicola TaxID=3342716 RepID=A0ABV6VZ28_9ACTN